MIKRTKRSVTLVEETVIDDLAAHRAEYMRLGCSYTQASDLAIMDQVRALSARVARVVGRKHRK